MVLANYLNGILFFAGVVGAALGVVRTDKPTGDPLKVVRASSAELVTHVGVAEVEPEVEVPVNLAQTTWLGNEISKSIDCLHNPNATPEDSVFYSARIKYLRGQKRPITLNPEKAQAETQAAIKVADDWYNDNRGIGDFNGFRAAFAESGLEIAASSYMSR